MYCSHCGSDIQVGDKFCSSCGAPVESQQHYYNAQSTYQFSQQPQQESYQHYRSFTQSHERYAEPVGPVSFAQAVRMFFTRYTDFNSRSGRSEFWYVVLFLTLVNLALQFLIEELRMIGWVPSIWSLVILIPGIALCVRRLHDIGKSGVFFLWALLPIVGQILILLYCCKESAPANQWGPNPNHI